MADGRARRNRARCQQLNGRARVRVCVCLRRPSSYLSVERLASLPTTNPSLAPLAVKAWSQVGVSLTLEIVPIHACCPPEAPPSYPPRAKRYEALALLRHTPNGLPRPIHAQGRAGWLASAPNVHPAAQNPVTSQHDASVGLRGSSSSSSNACGRLLRKKGRRYCACTRLSAATLLTTESAMASRCTRLP